MLCAIEFIKQPSGADLETIADQMRLQDIASEVTWLWITALAE